MYRVRTSPNGACLFTSLSLGLIAICQQSEMPMHHKYLYLDGFSNRMFQLAQRLRKLIVHWYRSALEMPISGTEIRRGDILSMELANEETDIEDRHKHEYLDEMSRPDAWASMPEIMAFAYMTGVHIKVWQRDADDIRIIDEIRPYETCKHVIHLYFSGLCHYDLLLDQLVPGLILPEIERMDP